MCVAGLAALAGLSDQGLDELVSQIRLPALDSSVKLKEHAVGHISGYQLRLELPHEHAHRTWADIRAIIGFVLSHVLISFFVWRLPNLLIGKAYAISNAVCGP